MNIFGFHFERERQPQYTNKVGLALSGGGARGFAHTGVIRAMNEVGLKADIVAGVSAGSVVAAMYAAGIPTDEMVSMFDDLSFSDLAEWKVPRDGFFSLDPFAEFLRKNIPYRRIEDLPIKTLICATDFDSGRKTAFSAGPLAECIAASCSIPIVFKPRVISGRRYVDGGVIANLPAWALRDKARFLVGVNCSPVSHTIAGDSIVQIALRSYELMAKNNAAHDMELCDMLIRTDDIAKYKVFDLKGIHRVAEEGYRQTMRFFADHGIHPRSITIE